jgi:hypothetical protein
LADLGYLCLEELQAKQALGQYFVRRYTVRTEVLTFGEASEASRDLPVDTGIGGLNLMPMILTLSLPVLALRLHCGLRRVLH